jgi:Predicted membrane protein
MSSAATADGRDSIELYLSRLDAALHTVPASEREEFVREIRGHIFERLEQSNDVAAVLAGVGDPEELAKQFCTETSLVQLARTGSPWRLMRTAARWALSGSQGFSMFMVALVGYGLGASFYISAMLKPIFPDHVASSSTTGISISDSTRRRKGTISPDRTSRSTR